MCTLFPQRMGLLNEEDLIVPYDYTFDGQGRDEIQRRSRELGIHPKNKGLTIELRSGFLLVG